MTIEEAIEILNDIHIAWDRHDLHNGSLFSQQNEALEMAIEALCEKEASKA
jgi:hypothetical protein